MVWFWATIFIVTLVVEIFTVEMISIWFSLGSFVAFFLALCTGLSETVQIFVFLIVSVLLLVCMRKICMKLLKNSKEKTNLELVVGTVQTLLTDITEDCAGEIKVNDIIWRAVSKDGSKIEAKSKVKILEINGNKFIVEKVVDEKKKIEGDLKDE